MPVAQLDLERNPPKVEVARSNRAGHTSKNASLAELVYARDLGSRSTECEFESRGGHQINKIRLILGVFYINYLNDTLFDTTFIISIHPYIYSYIAY